MINLRKLINGSCLLIFIATVWRCLQFDITLSQCSTHAHTNITAPTGCAFRLTREAALCSDNSELTYRGFHQGDDTVAQFRDSRT